MLDNTGQNMPSHEEMHFLAFEFTTKKDRASKTENRNMGSYSKPSRCLVVPASEV